MKEEMEKLELTKDMLNGEGSRTLFCGMTTDKILNVYGWGDENKLLKFVVCKGFVDDWCVYLESMETEQTHAEVKILGNKISPTKAELLVACDYTTMESYR